jgi:hypothetical protein
LSFNGFKWFEVLPDDDNVARRQGDLLVNASYLESLGVELVDGVDVAIERRFRLFTFWDVFVARDGKRVVFFGDRHPEYRRHAISCVFDGGRLNVSAESTAFETVPASVLECDLPADAQTLVLRSPSERIESPVFKVTLLLQRWRAVRPASPRKVVMWTMVLNQETLIVPWIEYHLMLGVEHFFVYDNGCEDETMERLAPLVARGVVTVFDWRIGDRYQHWGAVSWLYTQMAAMNHFLVRFGAECAEWVGMFDVDEFVFFPGAPDSIGALLARSPQWDDCAGVALRCRFFGGQRTKLLPEDFLPRAMQRAEADVEKQGYEKVFVRPRRIQWRVNIHSLVRERLCFCDAHADAHVQHYWWNRPRPNATTPESALWQRYGDRLSRAVDPTALRRSSKAQSQHFSQ